MAFKKILFTFVLFFMTVPVFAQETIGVGSKAPDFTLSNANGQSVTLSELLEEGPVVLSFYRGGWCPYCNEQLQSYQSILPQFDDLGAQLVAVSPEKPDSANDTAIKNELTFEVLSDHNNNVAREYDLIWTVPVEKQEDFSDWLKGTTGHTLGEINGVEGHELPIPATMVINQDRIITYMFKDEDYKKRADNEKIIEVLRDIESRQPRAQ